MDLVLTFNYKVDDLSTITYLGDIFSELLIYNKFDYKSISNSALNNFGIYINSFNPIGTKNSIFNSKKSDTEPKITTPESNDLNFTNSSKIATTNDTQNNTGSALKPETVVSATNTQPKQYICPNCGQSTKFKTTYCIKCGSILSD